MANSLYVIQGSETDVEIVKEITPDRFEYGENYSQYYYACRNNDGAELVQIIRNKKEDFWFGMYINDSEDICRLIPVHVEKEPQDMILSVCNWFNEGKKWKEPTPLPEVKVYKISKSLLEMEGMFGKHSLENLKRVQAYLNEPSVELWDDIHGFIVDGKQTIWQLLCNEDSSFPRTGRTTDITGEIVEEWKRIPAPLEVLRVIKRHTK